jgi:ribosomal protein S18 acetylase RimI-like enzyme
MYVYPEFRRLGIARELMKSAIDWCRDQRFRSVYLHASEKGRALYEQLGFKAANEMRLELNPLAPPDGCKRLRDSQGGDDKARP